MTSLPFGYAAGGHARGPPRPPGTRATRRARPAALSSARRGESPLLRVTAHAGERRMAQSLVVGLAEARASGDGLDLLAPVVQRHDCADRLTAVLGAAGPLLGLIAGGLRHLLRHAPSP